MPGYAGGQHRPSGPLTPRGAIDPERTDPSPNQGEPSGAAEGLQEDYQEDGQAWNARDECRDAPLDAKAQRADALNHRADLGGLGAA